MSEANTLCSPVGAISNSAKTQGDRGEAPAGHFVAGVPGGGASRPRGAKLRAWGFAPVGASTAVCRGAQALCLSLYVLTCTFLIHRSKVQTLRGEAPCAHSVRTARPASGSGTAAAELPPRGFAPAASASSALSYSPNCVQSLPRSSLGK